MNSIGIRQNDKKFLMFQYSARYFYNHAEILNYLVWALCIVNTIICNLPFYLPDIFKMLITFAFTLVSILLQVVTQRYIEIAAAMRKYVDYHLFEFEIPYRFNNYSEDKLMDIAIQVKSRNPRKADKQYRNTGTDTPPGVKDWYTGINPNDDKNSAILECQKQNIWWDRKLSGIYLKIINIFIILFIIMLLIVFIKNTVINLICNLTSLLTVISKGIWEHLNISDYRKKSISIDTLLETPPDTINIKYLMDIQERIDQRRARPFLTPNFLHKINVKRFHAIIDEKNTMK